jgi:hypothetical protein
VDGEILSATDYVNGLAGLIGLVRSPVEFFSPVSGLFALIENHQPAKLASA